MRLSIFQLTWQDCGEEIGLVFPSETEDTNHNFFYALPIQLDAAAGFRVLGTVEKQLKNNQYYFPIEVMGHYFEVNGKYENRQLFFSYGDYAPFTFFLNPFRFLSVHPFESGLRYRGRHSAYYSFGFLPIIPGDKDLLNLFFWQSRGIFVGYTPEFGESNPISGF